MLNCSLDPLHERLNRAQSMMPNVQSEDEFMAIGNYIGNLYRALICMGEKVDVNPILCFGSKKNYKKFLKGFNIYTDDLMHHFVLKKDFHSSYIEEILPTVEEELEEICPMMFHPEEPLTEKDFCEIFYAFLESINMMDLYRKLKNNKSIHSSLTCGDGSLGEYLGFTLFNPANGDIDIVISNFQYTLNHMNTLAHELGHGYDLAHFEGTVKEYNQYFYLSCYGEVLSRLMERLLHRFLIKNHIIPNTAKNSLIDFEDLNHDYLLQGFILSLLDPAFLLSYGFDTCDSDVVTKMIKKHFIEEAQLKEYVDDINNFNLEDILSYSYGDIISLFLSSEVERSGMNNDLLEEFMRHRVEPFQEEFLQKNGLNPSLYQKLYKKEIELIKK